NLHISGRCGAASAEGHDAAYHGVVRQFALESTSGGPEKLEGDGTSLDRRHDYFAESIRRLHRGRVQSGSRRPRREAATTEQGHHRTTTVARASELRWSPASLSGALPQDGVWGENLFGLLTRVRLQFGD